MTHDAPPSPISEHRVSSDKPVLVTGGSGFIAGHCIIALVEAGYEVRATLRSLSKEGATREHLAAAGLRDQDRVSFAAADLMADAGWDRAMEGVGGVLHVASPVAPGHVEDEDEVIRPAREGALRVLQAARDAGARRMVLTSAFHAVAWGHPHDDHVFTEEDWTVLDGPGVDAYGRSKTLAERAAWDFVASEGGGPELTAMLPTAVMGPIVGRSITGSNHIVEMLLGGKVPASPRLFFPIVDVRDVATAHVLALESPAAAGERLLLSSGEPLEMAEVARILREELGEAARRVPRRRMPDAAMRLAGLVSAEMRAYVPDLGYARASSHAKATRMLGWEPRPPREAVVAAGRSMVEAGLVA